MLADLPPVDVPELAATTDASVSASVPVAYGRALDADLCLDLDLGRETALALRGDADVA